MTLDLSPILAYLHSLPPIVISLIIFFSGYCILSILAILFGKHGIYCYIVIALLMANIQVLKVSQFSFFQSPIALGTELFATTFLATDILAEVYGRKTAQRAVYLGFFALLTWALFSFLTLAFRPVDLAAVQNDSFLFGIQGNLEAIFLPVPRLFIASIVAYFISQSVDIYIFSKLKLLCKNRLLWMRNNVSTILSSLIDNAVFSSIAFLFLSPNPVDFSTLLMTYILGTYLFRVFAALIDTPVIYILKPLIARKSPQALHSERFYRAW